MKWIKAPEDLKTLIERLMQPIDCERRPMFGYPAYFVNKHLFAGLFQDMLFVRLSPAQSMELRKDFPAVASLEPMPGRPMKDYTVIPAELRQDARKMARILKDAATWCRSLPPKATTARKAAKAPKARTPGKPATRPAARKRT
ncbi:MAG TPA: TfoX/Sxy family protein [Spirochaetia bacterium]|nr:TfoX/Sxy family protein [Spirochaetia bacterium]